MAEEADAEGFGLNGRGRVVRHRADPVVGARLARVDEVDRPVCPSRSAAGFMTFGDATLRGLVCV